MKLSDLEITPGVIVDVDDPEQLGRVKVNAPGLFSGNEKEDHWGVSYKIDNNVLTWVMPFGMNKYQMFSMPMTGQKVWVINNVDNHNEFWYIPFFEYIDVTEQIVKDKYNKDIEVIISRKNGDGSSQIYYDRTGGHVIHINDYIWNMKPNGDILCHGEQGDIDIRDSHVWMGRNSEHYEPAVFGDRLVKLFGLMAKQFEKLAGAHGDPDNCASVPFFKELGSLCAGCGAGDNNIRTNNTSVN